MDKRIGVLVFPAGEVNSVELHDALATSVNIRLYGGSSVDRHGPYIFKNYISDLPYITDNTFFESFNAKLMQYDIDVIFPTHDTVATFLVDNQNKIKAKIIAGDKITTAICRNKKKTYDLFSDSSFLPRIYQDAPEDKDFPVFIKPAEGQGSVGAKLITHKDELHGIDYQEYVICEYLPGDEYTVDCLTDKAGSLRVISPRVRNRTLAGISVNGQTRPLTDEIERIATEINRRMSFIGLWFFQIKKSKNDQFKLLEISTRCAGTMCLTRAKGINLPLLSVYVALGHDIEVVPNQYDVTVDRTLINRYRIGYEYDTVYLDFDDTLIIDGKVHLYTIMFVYQCKNSGKKVKLLTKHANKIQDTLKLYGIDASLFEEIIHITQDDLKTHSVKPDKAIFIDNAFQERKYVHEAYDIPVFDVDGIEALLDWRT